MQTTARFLAAAASILHTQACTSNPAHFSKTRRDRKTSHLAKAQSHGQTAAEGGFAFPTLIKRYPLPTQIFTKTTQPEPAAPLLFWAAYSKSPIPILRRTTPNRARHCAMKATRRFPSLKAYSNT